MTAPTQDQIYDAIRAADAAGDHDSVIRLGQYLQTMQPPAPPSEPARSDARQAGQQFVRSSPYGSTVGSLANSAQGAAFGFGDEIYGGLYAGLNQTGFAGPPKPLGEAYTTGRDAVRGVTEQFSKDYPGSALLANVSGGMATGGGPYGRALQAMSSGKGVGALGRLGQASMVGATTGAVSGAGEAESISDIPFEAVKHGAFGAATGFGMQGGGGVLRGVGNVAAPFLPTSVTGTWATKLAQRRVAEAIARADQTAQQAKTFMGQQKFGGPEGEAVIADTSDAARNLLDTVATLPGKTSDVAANFLRRRRVQTPERMDVLPDMLNKGNRYDTTLDLLNKVQAQQAKPLYAAVDNVVVPITPQLENLFQRPAFREAYSQAVTNAANRGEHLPSLDELSKIAPAAGLPVKVWDGIKRGFDDVIAAKKRAATPTNQGQNTLRDTRDIKSEMVSEIDRLTGGAYKAARDAHAGPAALKDALEEGTEVWSKSGTEIRAMLAQMSASEQQAFRIGVGEVVRAKVGSPSGQTELINAWKDRNLREKLEAIYGTRQDYNKALSKIYGEEQLRKLYGTNTGSATARRLQGSEDMAAGIAEDVAAATAAAKTGNPMGLLSAAKKVTSRMANPEPVRDEVGRILLQGGRRGREELARLEEIVRLYNEKSAKRAAITGVMGGTGSLFAL